MKRFIWGLLIVAVGCAGARRAGPVTPEAIRSVGGAMRDLEYFVGRWLAEGEDPETGRRFRLRYRIEPTLDGSWLTGFGESEEQGIKVRDFWGRDPITGDVVRIILDNRSTHGIARGKGWEGGVLRLEGQARGKEGEVTVRETITRLGPSEFKAVWEAKLEGGWTTYSIEHLKRE